MRKEFKTPSCHCGRLSHATGAVRFTHLGKNIGNLLFVEFKTTLEDVVGLSDELHVSILDTVMNHLYVVTRA